MTLVHLVLPLIVQVSILGRENSIYEGPEVRKSLYILRPERRSESKAGRDAEASYLRVRP